ncbi:MAG: peptidylprolyl isomerase [Clostridia bacterium]|nr:peptidylprolyl isomerase [Clostridia bacterium]
MKKFVSVCLVLVLMLAVFSSCTANKSTEIDLSKYEEKGNPIAVIEMKDGGAIVIELYADKAPNTVKNFISLANSGFYNGLTFHRVIETFMIQGGDPKGNGTGGPGYTIFGEFSDNDFDTDLVHLRGSVSMARAGSYYNPSAYYNTAGSQFFICVEDQPSLDGQYAVFGFVLEGMDIVDEIVSVKTDGNDKPVKDVVMEKVYVETFGVEYAEPETIAE